MNEIERAAEEALFNQLQPRELNVNLKLISDITVTPVQQLGGDHMVVAAAKVSVDGAEALKHADPENKEARRGLIRYLMRQKHGCYDSETEVLTDQGWKFWPDVRGDEKFATLNLDTDEIEYQRAINLVRKHVSGPMIRISTTQVDALVTPDHRMVAAPRRRQGWDYGIHPASDFLLRAHRVRLGGGTWNGRLHCPEIAELVGFIVADGSVSTSISFHLRRERKIKWLRSRHKVHQNNDTYTLIDPDPRLRQLAQQTYTGDGDRCFPPELLREGDVETLQALLRGYLAGDGSVGPGGKVTCSTVSRSIVDGLQEISLKVGGAAVETAPDTKRAGAYGNRPLYKVTLYNKRNSQPRVGWTTEARKRQVRVEDYEGEVHCVTVPNGTLYVRRNGKPMWCGNSPFEHGMMTFFVHMPLFIAREWTRHRAGWSYNGESGRYKQLEPVFWVPRRDRPMMRPPGYQAARPTYDSLDDDAWYDDMLKRSKWAYSVAYYQYLRELDFGVVPEVARRLLPTATYTSYWVTCNPRSLMKFLELRTHDYDAKVLSYPQPEIEEAARAAEAIFRAGWPDTYDAFVENGRVAP